MSRFELPKRPDGIIADCNKLSESILEAKYYGENDSSPEDVFWRVSLVVAIPDVVDRIVGGKENVSGIFQNIMWKQVFSEFSGYLDRVLARRSLTDIVPRIGHAAIGDMWKAEALKYYGPMCRLEFLPGTPTLINAGNKVGMLSSCFFIRVKDSMEEIFDTVKEVALISKAGGGVGLDISELRPQGAPVGSTKGVSSGPISFLKVFNTTGDQVKQGGVRRAALIATMRVDHPDILQFITCKQTEGDLQNFNISVSVTDEFMQAVTDDTEIELWHDAEPVRQKIRARIIWDALTEHAHKNGEPGILFQDRLREFDIFNGKLGDLSVNPCSEILLFPYESCNLAAINLSKLVTDGMLDTVRFDELVKLGVRFLDNTIDLNNYVLPKIEEKTLATRRIGLGTTGLHDALLKCKVGYGSDKSKDVISAWYKRLWVSAESASSELGAIRGVPEVLNDVKEHKWYKRPRRNAALVSCQPTGTVSMIMNQCSSGIEPVFKWEYDRKDSYGERGLQHWLLDEVGDNPMPDYAKVSTEISWQNHIEVQALIQEWTDNSISKTVILPNDATVEDVSKALRYAHSEKCKSTTVYRDGSREDEVLISKGKKKVSKVVEETTVWERSPDRPRAEVLFGCTFKIMTPSGEAYITINEDKEGVREVFITVSKAGSEVGSYNISLGRLISNSLKYRVPLDSIIEHLINQKSSPIFSNGKVIKSAPDAVAQVIMRYLREYEGFSQYIDTDELGVLSLKSSSTGLSGELCPECGEVLYQEGGCDICKNCGHSKCG